MNFNVAARQHEDRVIFLHKLVPGGANRSYGVAVAQLAGVPEIVLARARTLLATLESGSGGHGLSPGKKAQLEIFPAVPEPAPRVGARGDVARARARPDDAARRAPRPHRLKQLK